MCTHHAPCVKSTENDAGIVMVLHIMNNENKLGLLEVWLREHLHSNGHWDSGSSPFVLLLQSSSPTSISLQVAVVLEPTYTAVSKTTINLSRPKISSLTLAPHFGPYYHGLIPRRISRPRDFHLGPDTVGMNDLHTILPLKYLRGYYCFPIEDGGALGFLFNGIESTDDTPKRLELFLTGRQIPSQLEELWGSNFWCRRAAIQLLANIMSAEDSGSRVNTLTECSSSCF